MQSIYMEINNFIQSISQRELKRNPKLKRKIKILLKSIEGLRISEKSNDVSRSIALRYLNKEMLKG